MAKMKLFGLLFSFFNLLLISWTPILASNEMGPTRLEQCNLPAPDSFRITQVGGDFIKLAWNPIFPGAQHQLIIMESDGNGGYVTILVENNVSGDTYNADNLLSGTGYRFVLATKCAGGDPSEIKTIIDGITLIVDLMLDGRKPAMIGASFDCNYIPMEYNWKGFLISGIENGEYFENYFELVPTLPPVSNPDGPSKIQVKRYGIFNPIIAVNELKGYPNCVVPIRDNVEPRIRIDRLINGGPNKDVIGYVNLSQSSNPPAIAACPDYTDLIYPWKANFNLIPIFSPKALPPQSCNENKFRDPNDGFVEYSPFWVNNPFSNQLVVGINDSISYNDMLILQLFNSTGVVCHKQLIERGQEFVHLETEGLANGVYVLSITGDTLFHSQLIVKN